MLGSAIELSVDVCTVDWEIFVGKIFHWFNFCHCDPFNEAYTCGMYLIIRQTKYFACLFFGIGSG